MDKRCTNCEKYPFCEWIEEAGSSKDCEKWRKRKGEMKLNKVESGYFEFEKMED